MMMLTSRVLNNENSQDEAFTAIIKMFGSHLQVGIVQTGQRVTQCLWANIGEKPLNIIASWRNATSYIDFPLYKLNGLYVPITWPSKIFGRTFTLKGLWKGGICEPNQPYTWIPHVFLHMVTDFQLSRPTSWGIINFCKTPFATGHSHIQGIPTRCVMSQVWFYTEPNDN